MGATTNRSKVKGAHVIRRYPAVQCRSKMEKFILAVSNFPVVYDRSLCRYRGSRHADSEFPESRQTDVLMKNATYRTVVF